MSWNFDYFPTLPVLYPSPFLNVISFHLIHFNSSCLLTAIFSWSFIIFYHFRFYIPDDFWNVISFHWIDWLLLFCMRLTLHGFNVGVSFVLFLTSGTISILSRDAWWANEKERENAKESRVSMTTVLHVSSFPFYFDLLPDFRFAFYRLSV